MRAPRRIADAYGRYATLIAAQLAAVEAGDESGFESLADERDRLAAAIMTLQDEDEVSAEEAVEVRRQIESCLEADVRLRARMEALHARSLAAAKQVDGNRAAIKSYAGATPTGARVDFSL